MRKNVKFSNIISTVYFRKDDPPILIKKYRKTLIKKKSNNLYLYIFLFLILLIFIIFYNIS